MFADVNVKFQSKLKGCVGFDFGEASVELDLSEPGVVFAVFSTTDNFGILALPLFKIFIRVNDDWKIPLFWLTFI